ncbi:MAG: 7-carboxy-7-deazaguanine synthase QueE, partial [Mucinivorans sp.]
KGGLLLPLVEDFYTIQGEGFHSGEAAYFIRLGGCDVACEWCDARFTWNPRKFPPVAIEQIVARAVECPAQSIVITGGEPTLYPLEPLTKALRLRGLQIFIETSGTNELRGTFDWICLSPKRQNPPLQSVLDKADELKVIIQTQVDFEWAEANATQVNENCRLYLQPEWSRMGQISPFIVEYVKNHPEWRISLQSHKFLHIP